MVMSLADVARMEGRVAEVVGIINTSVAALVEVLIDVLATDAWHGDGVRSPEHWVTWQTGASPARARSLVSIARRLPDLPATRAAFGNGELTEDQVALICRHIGHPALHPGHVRQRHHHGNNCTVRV
jgi:hypothetical protein